MIHFASVGMEFLLCVMENLILYIFLGRCCEKRDIKWYVQIGLMPLYAGLIFIKDVFQLSFLMNIVYIVACAVGYSLLLFKKSSYRPVIYSVIYILALAICDYVTLMIYEAIYSELTLDYANGFHALRYNAALISKLMLFLIVIGISEKEKKKEEFHFSRENVIILITTFGVTITCLYVIDILIKLSVGNINDPRIDLLLCVLSMSIFSLNLIVYWAIKKINRSNQKEKEYSMIQYQNELLIKSAEENQALEEEWHKIRHDFNNHISCIDMLLQMGNIEKARAYIQKLAQKGKPKELNVHIGNEVADAVINQKVLRAKKEHIKLIVKGKLDEKLKIDDVDLCALLSNGLDNAIEAAGQVTNEEKRTIEVEFSSEGKQVKIEIRNIVKEGIQIDPNLATTKKDTKRHGIGMRSMQTAVNKYHGKLSWQCKEQIFNLSIMLPI